LIKSKLRHEKRIAHKRCYYKNKRIPKKNDRNIWKEWEISESFSVIIQHVEEIQEDHIRNGEIDLQFNQKLTIISYNIPV
jgi:hypothetical protein